MKQLTHWHHIIPRHAGGTDNPDNLVELTVEEHAEAHRKRYEEQGCWQDYIAWQGLIGRMKSEEICRVAVSMAQKGNKNRLGKTFSEESRKKISESLKGRKNGPRPLSVRKKISEAQRGIPRGAPSEETRQKISEALTGIIRGPMSDLHKKRLSLSKRGRQSPMKGRKMSIETREKMRISALNRQR